MTVEELIHELGLYGDDEEVFCYFSCDSPVTESKPVTKCFEIIGGDIDGVYIEVQD